MTTTCERLISQYYRPGRVYSQWIEPELYILAYNWPVAQQLEGLVLDPLTYTLVLVWLSVVSFSLGSLFYFFV